MLHLRGMAGAEVVSPVAGAGRTHAAHSPQAFGSRVPSQHHHPGGGTSSGLLIHTDAGGTSRRLGGGDAGGISGGAGAGK